LRHDESIILQANVNVNLLPDSFGFIEKTISEKQIIFWKVQWSAKR